MSKASKRRPCPAVGREIPAFECGENRNTGYRCPAECSFNPLTLRNYDQLLDIEETVDKKTFDRLIQDSAPGSSSARKLQAAALNPAIHALHGCVVDQMFLSPDANRKTCAQRWEAVGFPDLKNDEEALFRAKMGIRIGVLEVHQVIDGQQTEVVDLLEPNGKPFIIVDRSLARIGVRFAVYLCWHYALPHFWRLHGSAIRLPDLAQFEPQEVVAEIVRHLGGPAEGNALRLWLAKNILPFEEALYATAYARRADMFANLDVQWARTIYELKRPNEECRSVLEAVPQVSPDVLSETERDEGLLEAWVWCDEEGELPVKAASTREVLGRILAGATQWRLECLGQLRMELLRQKFENALDERVRFVSESRDDFAKTLARNEPSFDPDLVPPRLRENPQRISISSSRVSKAEVNARSLSEVQTALLRDQEKAFLDDTIPLLDGSTPRQAAQDPLLRPKLIRLVKQRVCGHDERNLETGQSDDINWLVQELGLTEILFPAPPRREPVKRTESPAPVNAEFLEGFDDSFDEVFEEDGEWSDLPLPPSLPKEPFGKEEARRRIDLGITEFETAAEALVELDAAGCTLIEEIEATLGDMALDKEFTVLLPYLIRIAFAFAPPGTLQPVVDPERLVAGIKAGSMAASNSNSDMALFFEDSTQPEMALIVGTEILHFCSQGPDDIRLPAAAQLIVIIILRAAIDEMDASVRELTSENL